MAQKELLSPCGLYCGVCGIYLAHKEDNWKFKEVLARYYLHAPEQIACRGCLSEKRYIYRNGCPIRECTFLRGVCGCHQCNDFPCEFVFELSPLGQKVVSRAIPVWRELGTDKFVELELERYHCPQCGCPLFRGARRCRTCWEPVDLD